MMQAMFWWSDNQDTGIGSTSVLSPANHVYYRKQSNHEYTARDRPVLVHTLTGCVILQ